MVYESDFYTTRRPYTRPISSHYTVTVRKFPHHLPYIAHKKLVSVLHTPYPVVYYTHTVPVPIRIYSRVRPSVIAAELQRIRDLPRPTTVSYVSQYLNSKDNILFDDEARDIRARADSLLRRIHVFVPRPSSSDFAEVIVPERMRSDDYIRRVLTSRKNAKKDEPEHPNWYELPEHRQFGSGHLASVTYTGGKPHSRRRPYYKLADLRAADVQSDVNLLSFYAKNRQAAASAYPDPPLTEREQRKARALADDRVYAAPRKASPDPEPVYKPDLATVYAPKKIIKPEPVIETEPIPAAKSKIVEKLPKPELKPEPEPEPEPYQEPEPKPEPEPVPVVVKKEPEPIVKAEPEPVVEAKAEPVVETKPIAVEPDVVEPEEETLVEEAPVPEPEPEPVVVEEEVEPVVVEEEPEPTVVEEELEPVVVEEQIEPLVVTEEETEPAVVESESEQQFLKEEEEEEEKEVEAPAEPEGIDEIDCPTERENISEENQEEDDEVLQRKLDEEELRRQVEELKRQAEEEKRRQAEEARLAEERYKAEIEERVRLEEEARQARLREIAEQERLEAERQAEETRIAAERLRDLQLAEESERAAKYEAVLAQEEEERYAIEKASEEARKREENEEKLASEVALDDAEDVAVGVSTSPECHCHDDVKSQDREERVDSPDADDDVQIEEEPGCFTTDHDDISEHYDGEHVGFNSVDELDTPVEIVPQIEEISSEEDNDEA